MSYSLDINKIALSLTLMGLKMVIKSTVSDKGLHDGH